MQISPKQLRQMAENVDDMHRDSMKTFREEIEELHFGDSTRDGRRSFLKKAGLGAGAVAFGSGIVPVRALIPAAGARQLTDLDIAVFAESVELAAVAAYEAGAGLLEGDVLTVAQTFLGHHQEHANAFAGIAGDAATGAPNAALVEALTPTLQGLSSTEDVLAFAKTVENQAVATYAFALTALSDKANAGATATILPVESAHAATLSVALGEGPEEMFPFGAFESSDIADGIDPNMFPVA